jgi:hypothetical protein
MQSFRRKGLKSCNSLPAALLFTVLLYLTCLAEFLGSDPGPELIIWDPQHWSVALIERQYL